MNEGQRDVERAVAELAERLPLELQPLAAIVYDYRWAWTPGAERLFRAIDPHRWRRAASNPLHVVEAAGPRQLATLARDAGFVAGVHELARRLALPVPNRVPIAGVDAAHPIAYFCSEFGLHGSLPIYGGGLGILAGDLLKAAADASFPMLGVGLLYRQGYFEQRLDPSGWQHEYWVETPFERLPLVLVRDERGEPVVVELGMRARTVRIQIWRASLGSVPLYLLDSDRADNHPIDRFITARLYVSDRHTRLAQYALLGIGGVRALDAMGIRPACVHLNEGHAALASFERIRALLEAGSALDDAVRQVRARTVFTTHTPIAAGNEAYGPSELDPVLGDWLSTLGAARQSLLDLGRIRPGDTGEGLGLTPLALRTSRASNGVSKRHGEVAREMWQSVQAPIGHVTNGVHLSTWMGEPMQALLDRALGPAFRERPADPDTWRALLDVPDEEIWRVRRALRAELVGWIREKSIRDRLGRGEPPEYVEQAARVFDPDVLTVGFARRVATYKRLYLLTRYPERGLGLLSNPSRPLQLVIAGKAHPADLEAKETLRALFQLKSAPVVGGRVAFVEGYDLYSAPRIVAGVDVWLNLPRPPLEASGTSGMKVVLNGGLNLSVLDGWWAEAFDGENGWAIATPAADAGVQDDHDARALMDILEHEVVPLFHARGDDSVPHEWVRRIKRSMTTLAWRFSADRMLADYARSAYAP